MATTQDIKLQITKELENRVPVPEIIKKYNVPYQTVYSMNKRIKKLKKPATKTVAERLDTIVIELLKLRAELMAF